MNVEAIEKGVRYLEEVPSRFDMYNWIFPAVLSLFEEKPPCGTVCCWAGGIALANGLAKSMKDFVLSNVLDLCNIPYRSYHRMFYTNLWPFEFSDRYDTAKNARERVAVLRDYWETIKADPTIIGIGE